MSPPIPPSAPPSKLHSPIVALLTEPATRAAVERTIAQLDRGELRVAERLPNGEWVTHAWVKQAILLYFAIQGMQRIEVGPFEFYDKIPLKKNLHEAGVRVVPPGVVRYGAFLEKGAIVMPGYVNIGAYVGAGTMVDTWATVGSCAQVGQRLPPRRRRRHRRRARAAGGAPGHRRRRRVRRLARGHRRGRSWSSAKR